MAIDRTKAYCRSGIHTKMLENISAISHTNVIISRQTTNLEYGLDLSMLPAETRFKLGTITSSATESMIALSSSHLHHDREFVLGDNTFAGTTGSKSTGQTMVVRIRTQGNKELQLGMSGIHAGVEDYILERTSSNTNVVRDAAILSAAAQNYHIIDQASIRFPSSMKGREHVNFLGLPYGTHFKNRYGNPFEICGRIIDSVDKGTNLPVGKLLVYPLDQAADQDAMICYIYDREVNCGGVMRRRFIAPSSLWIGNRSMYNVPPESIHPPAMEKLPYYGVLNNQRILIDNYLSTQTPADGFIIVDVNDFDALFS